MHKTREYFLVAMGVMMSAAVAVAAWEKDRPATPPVIPPNPNNLPKVLLIGDSISSGYYPSVAKALEGKAVVAKSADNGESTAVGVKKIDGWLGDTKWDVIHFNWGVWDMYGWQYASDDRSPAMYAQRLETLVVRMKKTGAKLIWATTTPVPPKPEGTMLKRWKTEVVIDQDLERQYQEAALKVMKKHSVQVNDLYALLKPRRSEFQTDDDVHMSGAASALMAKQVAECILKSLGHGWNQGTAATPKLSMLPSGDVKPSGWIWKQMDLDLREGLAGHYPEVSSIVDVELFVRKNGALSQPFEYPNGKVARSWWVGEVEGNWSTRSCGSRS